MTQSISVVIPAYNEADRLPETLRKISAFAESGDVEITEVIVVDDGSSDDTVRIARSTEVSVRVKAVRYSRNGGKGYAIRRGVLETSGDLVLISDADLSTPIEEVSKLSGELDEFDIAIGSRAVDRSLVRVRQAWYRDMMGRTFNGLMRGITGLPFQDTQCGFKLLSRRDARRVFELAIVDGFAWDVEFLLVAGKLGLSIAEVPVLWFNAPGSKVSLVGDSMRMLRDIIRMRLRLGAFRG